ncbi:MAG: serine hydrolase [Chitinophagales bacterium]
MIGLAFLCTTAMLKPALAQQSTISGSIRVSETPTDKLLKVQRFLRIYSNLGRFSGVAILAQDGKPIHRFTTKYSTLDFKIRCALSTQFNTCDITQSFTATAIMQLVDQGKIDLQDKIGQYIFDLPPQIGQTITIHQLLTHSSGLKDYYNLNEYKERFYDIKDMESLVSMVVKYPLDFAPGTQFKQSSSGYLLLGSLIEQVSNMSYSEYIQKYIFEPNKMEQSGLYSWFNPGEQQAVGYLSEKRGDPTESPEFWGAHAFGADALHCSIEDLLKFSNAFQNGKMLSSKAKNLMLYPHYVNPNTPDKSIGYGWQIKNIGGEKIIYQGGHLGGISATLRNYSKDNYTVLIYSNFGENTANIVADKIEEILTTDYVTIPNHSLGFVLYELIAQKGIDYVVTNFNNILQQNNLEINDMWPLYSLGQDYLKENKPMISLKLFQIGAEKYPNEPMVYDAMGDCYHQLGNKAMAKQAFQYKLSLMPHDARSIRMLQVIESANYAAITKPQEAAEEQTLVNTDNGQNSKEDKNQFIQTAYTPTVSNGSNSSNSNNENISTPNKIYTVADKMPEYPGGQTALHQYIYQNLRYPTVAYINGIEGTIYVDFVVDTYGNIIEAKINNPIEGEDGGLMVEALRIVNSLPKWTSGSHKGHEVMVKMTIPIQFNKGNFMKGVNIQGK